MKLTRGFACFVVAVVVFGSTEGSSDCGIETKCSGCVLKNDCVFVMYHGDTQSCLPTAKTFSSTKMATRVIDHIDECPSEVEGRPLEVDGTGGTTWASFVGFVGCVLGAVITIGGVVWGAKEIFAGVTSMMTRIREHLDERRMRKEEEEENEKNAAAAAVVGMSAFANPLYEEL